MAKHDHVTYPANSAGVSGLHQGFHHVAAKAHDKPGMFTFEAINASGTYVTHYVWLDSNGNLRHATSIPTDQDTAGSIFAHAYGQIQVKKIDFVSGGTGETASGWTIPNPSIILPFPWIKVTTADTGETMDVGTNGAGSDDPDGFLDGVSLNATGVVKGTLASGGQTLGALLRVDESGAGVLVPEPAIISGVAALTYTFNAAANTAVGSIYIPYIDLS